MKIIFSSNRDSIADHARVLVVKAQKNDAAPKGVAAHSARVPNVCEDCGVTYWHRDDPYVFFPHVGCRGAKNGAGF